MMVEPWFDPMKFGIFYGGIGGGVLGTLGGVLGAHLADTRKEAL